LSEPKPIIMKIGGSVITDKSGELAARTGEIDRLTREIEQAHVRNLVIVHGGGSFGHPAAKKYRIKDGYKEESQKLGFSETHHYMTVLNGLFMDALIWHNVPSLSITPSSCIITENGRIKDFEDRSLRTLLKMGFAPVLYGDTVFDTKLGFTILSGDQLVTAIGLRFNACRIIIGMDEDGLYDADPKTEKTAKLFEHLTLQELKKLESKFEKTSVDDVTGGIIGKMAELVPAVEMNIPVTIINATKPGNVLKALKGETVKSTRIEKE
jgi:isopentenyl phosphate kinase